MLPRRGEEDEERDGAAARSRPKGAHTGLCHSAGKLRLEMSISALRAQLPVQIGGPPGGHTPGSPEYKVQVVRAAPVVNDWTKDGEPEIKMEKEVSEGQVHPESGVPLGPGTQDCLETV